MQPLNSEVKQEITRKLRGLSNDTIEINGKIASNKCVDIGQYLFALKSSAIDVVRILDASYFECLQQDRKIAFLYLASYLLLQARNRQKSLELIEPLCFVLNKWIENYANTIKEAQYLEMGKEVLDMWEESKIFHPSFTRQLKQLIAPKLEVALLAQNKGQQTQEKVQKQVKSLNSCEEAKLGVLLELKTEKNQIEKKVANL